MHTWRLGEIVARPQSFTSGLAVVVGFRDMANGSRWAVVRPLSPQDGSPIACPDPRCGGGERTCAICTDLEPLTPRLCALRPLSLADVAQLRDLGFVRIPAAVSNSPCIG